MDQIVQMVEPMKQFSKDSIRLVKRCTKPDRKGKSDIFIGHSGRIKSYFLFNVPTVTLNY